MSVMIQLRNVPDELHRELKVRAAKAGLSLSDYLLGEITQIATLPSLDDMRTRLQQRPKLTLEEAAADAVRAERNGR